MTQVMEPTPTEAPAGTDLAAAVHRLLAASPEPLTPSKIRSSLPAPFRGVNPEELIETLRRQVAANALYEYPKYRSQQERYWDRAMPIHVAVLMRATLAETPLPLSQLRRKLPAYAAPSFDAVLQEQVAQGLLHRHPPAGSRGNDRYGARPPDAKDYLRQELPPVFDRLQKLGFTEPQLREAAMELLQEEEWAPTAEQPNTPEPTADMPESLVPETSPQRAEHQSVAQTSNVP